MSRAFLNYYYYYCKPTSGNTFGWSAVFGTLNGWCRPTKALQRKSQQQVPRSSCSSLFLWCQGQLGEVAWKRMDRHQHTTLRTARLLKTGLCSRHWDEQVVEGGADRRSGNMWLLSVHQSRHIQVYDFKLLSALQIIKLIIHVSAKLECGFTY